MKVRVTLEGRQFEVVNPWRERPEILLLVEFKDSRHPHWRRLPGYGQRYYDVLQVARRDHPNGNCN